MSLVEMVLGVTIAGIMMASIGMSMIVILRTDKPTAQRLTEATDVAFLQTYLPVDYSSSISRDITPTLQPIAGETLPGTNVLTLVREEKENSSVVTVTVSYRYLQVGDDWQLVRYEKGNPDYAGQLRRAVVARQLAPPPVGWTAAAAPTHAIAVSARNEATARPVGDDLQITFKSGNGFRTGGSGLASESELPSDYSGGTADPAAVRSRCGGRVTLILDVSGSITWVPTGPANVRSAAIGFIDAFSGTPSDVHVMRFSNSAVAVSPTTFGSYFSVLDGSAPQVAAAKTAVNAMPFGGGTNWEDGLYNATRTPAGVNHALLPELVVFVTDGDPTQMRTYPGNWSSLSAAQRQELVTQAAVTAANYARERDARVIGILVGGAAGRPASVDRLKRVVGNVAWDGTSATDVGNAGTADYFLPPGGDFAQLGGVLKAVAAGECGGTVTVQKKIDVGGDLQDPTQPWSYTSDVGVKELHPDTDVAITFDYVFDNPTGTEDARIVEQPSSGFQLDRVECSSNGVPLPNDRVTDLRPQDTGVIVEVKPNEAVSCTFISVAA